MANNWNANRYLQIKTVLVLIQKNNTGCCRKLQWTQLAIESKKCKQISSKQNYLVFFLVKMHLMLSNDKFKLLTYTFVLKV